MAGKDALSPERINEALAGLPDWRAGDGGLVTVFKMPTAAAARSRAVTCPPASWDV